MNTGLDRISGLKCLIGNTPLLVIEFLFQGEKRKLYAKAEHLNLTGSIKDRMAFHIIEQGYLRSELVEGSQIIEVTSGNTGIAFSAIGRSLGHPVTIFMPDWMSEERKNLIRSLGANIILVSKEEGGFLGCMERSEQYAQSVPDVFLPRQFSNQDNMEAHYNSTGPEIWWQLRFHALYPDGFVAGIGTGGTMMGVGRYLREQHASVKLYPLEPTNSPTLSTGCKVGKHRIQGISDEFIPPILDLDSLDGVIGVDDGDAILMAQKLACGLGLGVGISSGANFLGALMVQNRLGVEATVVTVFPDDNKKYLSTDLLSEQPVKDGYMAPDINLLSVRAFKRVCHTCCDPQECLLAEETAFHGDVPLPYCARRA